MEALSDAEQIEFYACEDVLETASSTFVQSGLAFARIRDALLYRVDYDSFDVYCREKWQYGRRYVDFLIAAAQIFNQLRTIGSHQKPAHERQLRPLIGLSPEQVLSAWGAHTPPKQTSPAPVDQRSYRPDPPAPDANGDGPSAVAKAPWRAVPDLIGCRRPADCEHPGPAFA